MKWDLFALCRNFIWSATNANQPHIPAFPNCIPSSSPTNNRTRYHKTHGHSTQQLHENGDGTFSIVNPETSTPYPGTLGMEKEKPFKCDVCGKRYKNLNGLKYVS